MIWQEAMQRDAVRIAFPEWDLQATDVASFTVRWDNGEYDWEEEFEPEGFDGETHLIVDVHVRQSTGGKNFGMEFTDAKAVDFLHKLFAPEGDGGEVVSALALLIGIAQREAIASAELRARRQLLEIGSARGVYETAMYYASISDDKRAEVHDLAQNHGGKPGGRRVGIYNA